MHIKTPSYMAFGQFEDIRKSHDSAHTPERLLTEASQIFGSLKVRTDEFFFYEDCSETGQSETSINETLPTQKEHYRR